MVLALDDQAMESLTQRRSVVRSCRTSAVAVAFGPLVLLRWSVDRSLDVLVPFVVAEVIRRVDLDAMVERVDIAGLVEEVVAAIDLPEIIRESTGVMVSDSVWRARLRGVAADEAVSRLRDRLAHRP